MLEGWVLGFTHCQCQPQPHAAFPINGAMSSLEEEHERGKKCESLLSLQVSFFASCPTVGICTSPPMVKSPMGSLAIKIPAHLFFSRFPHAQGYCAVHEGVVLLLSECPQVDCKNVRNYRSSLDPPPPFKMPLGLQARGAESEKSFAYFCHCWKECVGLFRLLLLLVQFCALGEKTFAGSPR